MPIVDVHAHVFPDNLAHKAVPALEAQGTLRARYDGTVAGLLAAMRVSGVDISVLQPVATKPTQVKGINDWMASLGDEHVIPFGAMHPDLENAAEEVARIASLGLRGFKMHPEHQRFAPHDPRVREIFDAAEELGVIVFLHAGADEIHDTLHGSPESFAALLDEHPRLKAVLAHMGGYRCWDEVSEFLAGRDVWFDTAYTPRILPDDDFVALIERHGVDRVLFGSDGPWTDPALEIAHLRGLGLSSEDTEAILGGNAMSLLGLR